jgi:hypothetical protein
MFAQNPASGNPLVHHVGIIIPYTGYDDDSLINFAGLKLSERFGAAAASFGVAGWQDSPFEAVIVHSITGPLTELDLTVLMGIAIQCAAKRDGIAVFVDDDVILM